MIYEVGTVIKEEFSTGSYWELILDRESGIDDNGEKYARYTLRRWSDAGSRIYEADCFTIERIHNWINGSSVVVAEDEEEIPDFVLEAREELEE